QRRIDDDARRSVREEISCDNADVAHAGGLSRVNVFLFHDALDIPTDEPGKSAPADETYRDVKWEDTAAKYSRDRQRKHDRGDREGDVDNAHDGRFNIPAVIAGNETQ